MTRLDLAKIKAPSAPPPPIPNTGPERPATIGTRITALTLLLAFVTAATFALTILLPAYLVHLPGRGAGRDIWLWTFLITGTVAAGLKCYLAYGRYWFDVHVDSRLISLRAELPHTTEGLKNMVDYLEGLVWAFALSGLIQRNTFLIASRPEGDVSTICDLLRRLHLTARRLLDNSSSSLTADRVERGNLESGIAEFVRVVNGIGDPKKMLGEKLFERKYVLSRYVLLTMLFALFLQGLFAGVLWLAWYFSMPN